MAHWSIRAQLQVGYSGYFSQVGAPTSGDIVSGNWGWWFDTGNSILYNVRNDGGTMKFVEAAA